MKTIHEQLGVLGLNEDQTALYMLLLDRGYSKASTLTKKSHINRSTVYKVLRELEDLDLVDRRTRKNSVDVYYPTHPSKLTELLEVKQQALDTTALSLAGAMGSLVSKFNLLEGKPNVRFKEGKDGLTMMHKDMLLEGQDMLLIRSIDDRKHSSVGTLINKHIDERVAAGLKTRALTPFSLDALESSRMRDKKRLVTRHFIAEDRLSLPAQISIYGNKVAMVSYGDILMVTIIESTEISTTFRILFEYMWESSSESHKKFLAENPITQKEKPKPKV